jgi:DNA-binding NtrC family response regulator
MNRVDKPTVLVVDDDPLVLAGFREVLLRDGFDVTPAGSGREALEMLNTRTFDVVLTDMLMPKINGFDVLRYSREKAPDSIVIMVTGYASVRSAVEALRLGAYDYLIKPAEDEELLFRVRMGVERLHMRKELRSKEIDVEKMKAIAHTAVTVNDQINTPLNVILNSAEYIRMKTLPECGDLQQSLDFISQEVSKIKSVIQRLARIADPQLKEYAGGTTYMVDMERSGQRTRASGPESGDKQRILVVDDEQFMVHTLAKILELLGYEVLSAMGGKEALQLFLNQHVDLVVSDLHMPEMNGLELLTAIKTRNPAVPVVLVTGYGIDNAREIATAWKADGFLGKPFKITELKTVIDGALQRRSGFESDPITHSTPQVA